MKKNNANSWLEILASEIGGRVDVVPEGWVTISQVQTSMGMTIGEAETFMRKGMKSGRVERKKFRVNTCGAGTRDVWHYNMKK